MPLDHVALVLGQHVRLYIRDIQPAGDGLGRGPIVAGQHYQPDAVIRESPHRLRARLLDRIGDREEARGQSV